MTRADDSAVVERATVPQASPAIRVLPGLSAATHRPHALHAPERVWVEKNCYLDLWIELVHALNLDPCAMLGCVATLDFDVDQWTFVKPPPGDLRTLYGIEVQELSFWRPLVEHAVDHLAAGRWIAVEVDAFWLPDTAGIDYRRAHAKTTIVLDAIDLAARRLGYFHNAGYHELEGEDFERLLGPPTLPTPLPPFAETVRIDRRHAARAAQAGGSLRAASLDRLREHLAWRARSNPIERYRARFESDLVALRRDGGEGFHRWAFAGLRQLGAAAELLAIHGRWLDAMPSRAPGAADFERIAVDAKALLMKTARAVYTAKPVDAGPLFASMAASWDAGFAALESRAQGG